MSPYSPRITTSTSPQSFSLSNPYLSYIFHVGPDGDLVHDHFGSFTEQVPPTVPLTDGGWGTVLSRSARELGDLGRGDFRIPTLVVRKPGGNRTLGLKYESYESFPGKKKLPGLPATFGSESEVSTLIVQLRDPLSDIRVKLSYSIFHQHPALARSMEVINESSEEVVIERADSWGVDLPSEEWEMRQLSGDWAREMGLVKRPVEIGTQGFANSTGYSSALHNPFLCLTSPQTTNTHGKSYGFSLIYTGSHHAQVERSSTGLTRIAMGINPETFEWVLQPGEGFVTPECLGVFEADGGIGGMSRTFHRVFREHLSRSPWTDRVRPVLMNNWEATYFTFTQGKILQIARTGVGLGVELFVLDDGWFGVTHPRLSDDAGLGDWVPNPSRFPDGLEPFVREMTGMRTTAGEQVRFGIWVEMEMINPSSELYETHPDWALHSGSYGRTEQRNQLVLDLSLREVQDYIIGKMDEILSVPGIGYIKWDNNRAMHEVQDLRTPHAYILGLYRVLDTLTTKYPDVLWEGCASGGGRFDPGLLHYWPQHWTSDNTDPIDRLSIQMNASLVYPPSCMGAHVSASPNHQTGRETPLEFRVHVALMGGSFGFELDFEKFVEEERKLVPGYIELSKKISPIVVAGDLWRLGQGNSPSALFVTPDRSKAVLFAFQIRGKINWINPAIVLQGLDRGKRYRLEEEGREDIIYSGQTLMSIGLSLGLKNDMASRVILLTSVE